MIGAFFIAALKLGFPVGLTAYLLVGFMLDSGKLGTFANNRELNESLKAYKKEGKKEKRKEGNVALKKWMNFGGGFYGTAAVYTYAYIEVGEVFQFIGKVIHFLQLENWNFPDLVEIFVGFLINSLMNFLDAILWFTYWDMGSQGYIWIAFLVAYLGYAAGAKIANQHVGQGIGHVRLWRWWKDKHSGVEPK